MSDKTQGTGSREEMIARLEGTPLPPMVVLDVTNTCNLSCIHCPQPGLQAAQEFKSRHMAWEHFTKIVDEIRANDVPILLRFAGDGEPTVHPRLFDMLEYAKANCAASVDLTTNGVLLTPKRIDRLLKNGVDIVDISIDALEPETYAKIRKGGDFRRLMSNIDYLLQRRMETGATTKAMVSLVVQDENQHEVEAFRDAWSKRVEWVMVRNLHSATGSVSEQKREESAARSRAETAERYPCPHLWKRLTIDFTGTIKFCAHEWLGNRDVIVGNMETDTISGVWRGERLAEVRAHHVRNTHPEGFICTNCLDWAASQWDWGFERLVDKLAYGKPTLMPELPPLP